MGFKPRDDSSTRIGRRPDAVFDEEAFVTSVFQYDYFLVIGSKVIMNTAEEPSGDVNTYILRSVNRSLGTHYERFDDVIDHAGGSDPIRNLLNSESDFTYDLSDISPELRGLLETRLFPLVLTTTFDAYLETLMRSIWGERLRVVNIDDSRSLNAWRDELLACRDKRKYTEPTLFYIFGKADRDEKKYFVRTDNDAIRIMEKWMQMPKEDAILQFIRSKKLLALGCQYENWYFRSFWYVLKHDFSRFHESEVAMEFEENDRSDENLKQYFDRMRIFNHGNARAFMRHITESLSSLEPDNPFRALVARHRRQGGIFLSYCSRDVFAAGRLFVLLCQEGFRVWFDNDALVGGDSYDQKIRQAISSSPVFISLLSPSVAADSESSEDFYYRKEWQIAAETGGAIIIPVAVDGYDLRSAYHSRYEQVIGRAVTGIDLTAPDGFQQLVKSLDQYLNRL